MVRAYKVVPLTDIDYKITAVECFENKVYAGDNKGVISLYNISQPESPVESLVPTQITTKISKTRIEKLRIAPETNTIFALSDGNLIYFDSDYLSNQRALGKSVNLFTINEAGGGGNVLLVQRKKI
jgi:hypothetical protein